MHQLVVDPTQLNVSHITVTNSSKSTFHDCGCKYFFEYIRRLTSLREPVYFTWGETIHRMAELCDQGMKISEALEQYKKESADKIIPGDSYSAKMWAFNYACCSNCIGGHMIRYKEYDKRYEVHVTETKFDYRLPNGASFRGKIDAIIRDRITGDWLVRERKTAAQTGPTWWESTLLDSQGKGYMLAARQHLGFPVAGVLYDVYKKPQITQGKYEPDETYWKRISDAYLLGVDKYYERKIIRFSEDELEEYEQELMQTAVLIAFSRANGYWPRHHPKNRMGKCAFFELCVHGEHTSVENLFRVRSHEEMFKELCED